MCRVTEARERLQDLINEAEANIAEARPEQAAAGNDARTDRGDDARGPGIPGEAQPPNKRLFDAVRLYTLALRAAEEVYEQRLLLLSRRALLHSSRKAKSQMNESANTSATSTS